MLIVSVGDEDVRKPTDADRNEENRNNNLNDEGWVWIAKIELPVSECLPVSKCTDRSSLNTFGRDNVTALTNENLNGWVSLEYQPLHASNQSHDLVVRTTRWNASAAVAMIITVHGRQSCLQLTIHIG